MKPVIRESRVACAAQLAAVIGIAAAAATSGCRPAPVPGASSTVTVVTAAPETGSLVSSNTPLRPILRTASALTADRINARIHHSNEMAGARVTVFVDPSGMATLTGFVQNQQQRRLAIRAADDTPGIASVKDKLEIRSGGSETARLAASRGVGGAFVRSRRGGGVGGGADGSGDDGTDNNDTGDTAAAFYGSGYEAGGGVNLAASANPADPNAADPNADPNADPTADTPADGRNTLAETAAAASAADTGPAANRNDSSEYGVNGRRNSAYSGDPGSAVSRRGGSYATGNTTIGGVGHTWGAIPQNGLSQYAGTHSTQPR